MPVVGCCYSQKAAKGIECSSGISRATAKCFPSYSQPGLSLTSYRRQNMGAALPGGQKRTVGTLAALDAALTFKAWTCT